MGNDLEHQASATFLYSLWHTASARLTISKHDEVCRLPHPTKCCLCDQEEKNNSAIVDFVIYQAILLQPTAKGLFTISVSTAWRHFFRNRWWNKKGTQFPCHLRILDNLEAPESLCAWWILSMSSWKSEARQRRCSLGLWLALRVCLSWILVKNVFVTVTNTMIHSSPMSWRKYCLIHGQETLCKTTSLYKLDQLLQEMNFYHISIHVMPLLAYPAVNYWIEYWREVYHI